MTRRASPRSETANTRADVPGGRVRRVIVRIAIQTTERGDYSMAKKAKGGKKKAAKKR
jgi:hypothetical protein